MAETRLYVHNPKNDYMKLKELNVGVINPPREPLPQYRLYNPHEVNLQYNRIEQDVFAKNQELKKERNNHNLKVTSAFLSVFALAIFAFIVDNIKLLRKLLKIISPN